MYIVQLILFVIAFALVVGSIIMAGVYILEYLEKLNEHKK